MRELILRQAIRAKRLFRGRWPLAMTLLLTFRPSSTSSLLPPASGVDPRFAPLERFFRYYSCPPPHYVRTYLHVADYYGLDYRLLPAVSVRETQCGLYENQNNRWGYNPGHPGFESVEEGIELVARQLAEGPWYEGKTLRQKLFTYNPMPQYPSEVIKLMRQVK